MLPSLVEAAARKAEGISLLITYRKDAYCVTVSDVVHEMHGKGSSCHTVSKGVEKYTLVPKRCFLYLLCYTLAGRSPAIGVTYQTSAMPLS